MTTKMDDSQLINITQVEECIKVASYIKFEGINRKEKCQWLERIIGKFNYFSLRKKDKSTLKKYMIQMTGFSDAQLTRLIAKKKKVGKILPNQMNKNKFPKIYTPEDTARLIETDKAHSRLSGPATKKIFQRMFNIFRNERFVRLQNISVAHIYNLRRTRQYSSNALFWTKTKSTPVNIGERRKPDPDGKPGFIRVDTVHQGDLDKEKGVYHINLVDEVTQTEIVGCVEKISEQYLLPLLESLIKQFNFRIINFHSDNGSEFINHVVAKLLNKLLIAQTKSRARHCNDNALVEGKNGSIIRKHMGRNFIAQRHASAINRFYEEYLNPYLNYHRPCGFPTIIVDKKGKQKKVYKIYLTPYDKLKSLPNAEQYLKEGIVYRDLDKIVQEKSDNECAALMQKAKVELFKNFNETIQLPRTYMALISGSSLD